MFGTRFGNNASSGSTAFEFGNALRFDGVNDTLRLKTPVSKPALVSGFVFSLWIKFPTTPSFEYVLGDLNSPNQWFRINSLSSIAFRSRAVGAATTTWTVSSMSNDTWYHIACSLSEENNILWINGDPYVGDSDNYDNENIDITSIGSSPSGYGEFILDEVAIQAGTAFTQNDVDFLFNSGSGNFATGVMSPDIYYRLNQSGTETISPDSSGNNNFGELFNFTLPGSWVTH